MSFSARAILICALAILSISTNCFADEEQNGGRVAINAPYKTDLNEAVALLDSWRGDSSVLEAARVRLDRILASYPNVAAAHREYARYYIMSGYISGNTGTPASLVAAEKSLDEAFRIAPNYAEAYVLAGHLYLLQNRIMDAKKALAKARSIGTSDPWLSINTAEVLLAEGRLDEAANNYSSVITSGTANSKAMTSAFSGLIKYYKRTGQIQKAEETYNKQIAYEPQSAWPYGNYGAFLLCISDDADAAIIQFRKALDRMNYGMARSGLAAALYRKWVAQQDGKQSGSANSLLSEAQSLRAGSPSEVVVSFCQSGPAVLAMVKQENGMLPPKR